MGKLVVCKFIEGRMVSNVLAMAFPMMWLRGFYRSSVQAIFCTSPTLFRHLFSVDINACGTATSNRKEFPPELKPYIKKLNKADVERGKGVWLRDGVLAHVLWTCLLPFTMHLVMTRLRER